MSEFDKLKDDAEQYAQQHPQQVQEGEHDAEKKFGLGGGQQQDQGGQQQDQGGQDQGGQDQGGQDGQDQGAQDQGNTDQQQQGY
jgi:hypothetical protein